MSVEQKITQAWYRDHKWIRAFTPLSKIYQMDLNRRRQKALSENRSLPVPVVVIGNLTVGGTGKTPLIIELCRTLSAAGISVGVISRGYGAQRNQYPYKVSATDSATDVGDEPLMICQQSKATVVIDPDRYLAAKHLIERQKKVDVILSDDGMQHFGLPRDLEILVVDGSRELGNELLIPAGPLREPAERLKSVDFCLINGAAQEIKSSLLKQAVSGHFQIKPTSWVQITTGRNIKLDEFEPADNLNAVAAIGNPQRFFNTLKDLGLDAQPHPLDDHQVISRQLIESLQGKNSEVQILMTMKDAVKCSGYATENCWALDVRVEMNTLLEHKILSAIKALVKTLD